MRRQGELDFWFGLLVAPWKSSLRVLEESLVQVRGVELGPRWWWGHADFEGPVGHLTECRLVSSSGKKSGLRHGFGTH